MYLKLPGRVVANLLMVVSMVTSWTYKNEDVARPVYLDDRCGHIVTFKDIELHKTFPLGEANTADGGSLLSTDLAFWMTDESLVAGNLTMSLGDLGWLHMKVFCMIKLELRSPDDATGSFVFILSPCFSGKETTVNIDCIQFPANPVVMLYTTLWLMDQGSCDCNIEGTVDAADIECVRDCHPQLHVQSQNQLGREACLIWRESMVHREVSIHLHVDMFRHSLGAQFHVSLGDINPWAIANVMVFEDTPDHDEDFYPVAESLVQSDQDGKLSVWFTVDIDGLYTEDTQFYAMVSMMCAGDEDYIMYYSGSSSHNDRAVTDAATNISALSSAVLTPDVTADVDRQIDEQAGGIIYIAVAGVLVIVCVATLMVWFRRNTCLYGKGSSKGRAETEVTTPALNTSMPNKPVMSPASEGSEFEGQIIQSKLSSYDQALIGEHVKEVVSEYMAKQHKQEPLLNKADDVEGETGSGGVYASKKTSKHNQSDMCPEMSIADKLGVDASIATSRTGRYRNHVMVLSHPDFAQHELQVQKLCRYLAVNKYSVNGGVSAFTNWRDFAECAGDIHTDIVFVMSSKLCELCKLYRCHGGTTEHAQRRWNTLLLERNMEYIPCIVLDKLRRLYQDKQSSFTVYLVIFTGHNSNIDHHSSTIQTFLNLNSSFLTCQNTFTYKIQSVNLTANEYKSSNVDTKHNHDNEEETSLHTLMSSLDYNDQ